MKMKAANRLRLGIALTLVAFTIVMVSWGQKQNHGKKSTDFSDTIPNNREKKTRDLDEVLENSDDHLDWEKFQKELSEGLQKIDVKKIQQEIDKAIKDLDFEKFQSDLSESIAKIDVDKIKQQVQEAMADIDFTKMKEDINRSLKQIDVQKIQKEVKEALQKVKDVDLKKVKEELEKIKPQLEQELSKAKVEIEKARVTIQEFKTFVSVLEADGLIQKQKGYLLKHENGVLYINGEKASDATYSKYKSFLDKHPKFNFSNGDDDFNFNID